MIFAAGLGTRLLPLTRSCPKALVRLQDKPLLQHVIEKLWAHDIYHIVINVHHYGQQIIDMVEALPKPPKAHFYISDERPLLRDTGGGLRYAMQQFATPGEDWLIHNVDIWSEYPLHSLMQHHSSSRADISMLVQRRQSSRYLLLDADSRLCAWYRPDNNQSIPADIQVDRYETCAFNGVHIVNERCMQQLPKSEVFPIIPAYIAAAKQLHIQGVWHGPAQYMDLGKPQALRSIEQYLKHKV